MEKVETLHERIVRGDAYMLSSRVLRDLRPSEQSVSWLHFDICPQNIGVLPDGRCAFIDVESFYLEGEDRRYDVSLPAWKPFRALADLNDEVDAKLAGRAVDRSLALRKVSFEVALAAAECVLGPLPPSRDQVLRPETMRTWAASQAGGDPAVEFWRREVLAAADTGAFRPSTDMCSDLERMMLGRSPPARDSHLTPAPQALVPGAAPPIAADVHGGWEAQWDGLRSAAHALRAGLLGRPEVRQYREALEKLTQQYPEQRELWDELLLVLISYERDPIAALDVVQVALKRLPTDLGLGRLRNIVEAWASERQNEQRA